MSKRALVQQSRQYGNRCCSGNPDYLFVGEAKDESSLGASGEDLLVHQLIRQHVLATILADIRNATKEVVHFFVVDEKKLGSLKNTRQVKFMERKRWLKPGNVLTWGEINLLARGS